MKMGGVGMGRSIAWRRALHAWVAGRQRRCRSALQRGLVTRWLDLDR